MRLALVVVLASVAAASASIAGVGGGGGGDIGAPAKRGAHLRVHGTVVGLYPGARKKLHVHVRNTSPRSMQLRALRTKPSDASAACARDYLHVKRMKRSRARVPGNSRTTVNVSVRMAASAPDACQGASWPLRYRVRVKRP